MGTGVRGHGDGQEEVLYIAIELLNMGYLAMMDGTLWWPLTTAGWPLTTAGLPLTTAGWPNVVCLDQQWKGIRPLGGCFDHGVNLMLCNFGYGHLYMSA